MNLDVLRKICLIPLWYLQALLPDERDNPVDYPNIYNVVEDNMLLLGVQSLTTGSVLKILLFCQTGSVIIIDIPEIVLLSSLQSYKHLIVVLI